MKFIKKNYLYISFIILVSLTLRIYNLNFDDFWFDELASLWIADPSISFDETLERNIKINKGPHLIFTIILKYFFLLFGYNPDIARIVPLIFGLLSVPAIIYLIILLDKNKSWILIGFLISINYYLISYSQELRSYSLSFFLSIISIIFFLKTLNKNNFIYNFLFYLSSLIAVINHVFVFIIIFSQFLFLLFYYTKDKKIFFIISFNILLIFLTYLFFMYETLLTQMNIKDFWIRNIELDFLIDFYFSRFFGSKIMGAIYLFTLLYILWIKKEDLLSHNKKLILFLLILVNSYFLPITYSFISTPILTDRYIIFVLIPILILISILINKIESKKIRNLIISILILSTLINNYMEIFHKRNSKPQFKKSILFINNSKFEYLMLSDNTNLNNNLVSNYIKLINNKNNDIKFLDNIENSSFKDIWVMCYLPMTKFTCTKPQKLNNNFIKIKSKNFNLIRIEFYKNKNTL